MNTNYSNYLTNISDKLNISLKRINNGGFNDSTETLFKKLKSDNIVHEANMNIKGIDAVIEKYKLYDIAFTTMIDSIEKYKNKTIEKLNDSNSAEGMKVIDEELNGIIGGD